MRKHYEKVCDLGFDYALEKGNEDYKYTLYITQEGNFVRHLFPNEKFLYINVEKNATLEEAEELVKQGKAKKYEVEELFRLAFPLEDDFYRAYYGMTKRTKEYFDNEKKKLHILNCYTEMEDTHRAVKKMQVEGKLIKEMYIRLFSKIEIYEYDNLYLVNEYISSIDTFDTLSVVFDELPTEDIVNEALDLLYIEQVISLYRDESICRNCEEIKAFVDFYGENFREKFKNWKYGYCESCMNYFALQTQDFE